MKLVRIESVGELRRCAPAWDDLWWRSDSTMPTQRAELVAQWVEHFAPQSSFVALAIEDGGQLIAALPLHCVSKAGLRIGMLTANCWSDSGTLLLDPAADASHAVELLLQGVRNLHWPLLMLDGVDLESITWRQWQTSHLECGLAATSKPNFRVGQIDITHDWDAYVAAWSSNHRRATKKLREAAASEGEVELLELHGLASDDIEPHLHQAFEIEDNSWKGDSGSSILRTPGAYDFFLRQAQQLSQWGQFELYFVHFNGQPIAFDYCYSAKGVLASHKIGFDNDYRRFGPFQLLRAMQLENLFADPQRRMLDTLGIMGEAKAKWSTSYRQSSRLVASGGTLLGQAAIAGYQHVWPTVRKWLRRTDEPIVDLEPGSARLLQNASRNDDAAELVAV